MGPPPHRSRQNSLPESDTTHHPGPKGQGTLFIIRSVEIASWAITQKLGISPKTAERYSRLPELAARRAARGARRAPFGRSLRDPYKPQLLDWWNSGIREPSLLMKWLEPGGFEGSLRTLQRYLSGLRKAQGLPPVRSKVA